MERVRVMPRGVFNIDGRRKVWTPDEDMRLADLIEQGLSDEQIARKLGRSLNSVHVRASRFVHRRDLRPMSARKVADTLGVKCSKSVSRWIDLGYLKGRHSSLRAGASRRWLVTEEALMGFIEDARYWHLYDPNRIPDRDLREWAVSLRNGTRYLTLTEVADRYCVARGTVSAWLDRGHLPFVRYGNRRVPESALVGFVIPSEREKHGQHVRRFTSDEDRVLMQLRCGDDLSWSEIAARMRRSLGSCAGRYKRLTARQTLREAA